MGRKRKIGKKQKEAAVSKEPLIDFGALLETVGPDDPRIDAFIKKHKANKRFVLLAKVTRGIKRKLLERQEGKRR